MYAAKVRSRVYHVVASETGDHEALTVCGLSVNKKWMGRNSGSPLSFRPDIPKRKTLCGNCNRIMAESATDRASGKPS